METFIFVFSFNLHHIASTINTDHTDWDREWVKSSRYSKCINRRCSLFDCVCRTPTESASYFPFKLCVFLWFEQCKEVVTTYSNSISSSWCWCLSSIPATLFNFRQSFIEFGLIFSISFQWLCSLMRLVFLLGKYSDFSAIRKCSSVFFTTLSVFKIFSELVSLHLEGRVLINPTLSHNSQQIDTANGMIFFLL